MNEKPTNPKDALGIKKVPLHCIPCGPLLELGLGMMEGGRKYGAHNYREMGVKASVYYDAAMRHLIDWWEGEDIDPDSNIHHVSKAMTALLVLRDSMLMGNYNDDRPYRYPNGLNMAKFNKQAAGVIEKYSECKTPFVEKEKCKAIAEHVTEQQPEDLLVKEAWEPADTEGCECPSTGRGICNVCRAGATIECVPSKGWQIRLANGMFLGDYEDFKRNNEITYCEFSVPFYHITKEDAKECLTNYLETLK